LVRMYSAAKSAAKLPQEPGLAFCYGLLNDVSRSFAIVIQQLPNPLRDAVCVFYLVLRGLDTVEDDMALSDDIKLPMLHAFHEKIYERNFHMECGYKHYKRLMKQFGTVVDVFLSLDEGFQKVIADITKRMGDGMAEFITKDVVTVDEYERYCHYVAGLVGIGLSQLFASSGLESPKFALKETLSNQMGLFLQKTNIIRDYLEDIVEEPAPRMFWPKQIWGQYGDKLADFKEAGNRKAAVQCLNHMIVDALQHLPACVQYMEGLQHSEVFRFCAIPQIMAIGTLGLCYNNGRVFTGVVKMRRGLVSRVFDSCSDMGDLFQWFLYFLTMLSAKVAHEVDEADPTLDEARRLIASHTDSCSKALAKWKKAHPPSGAAQLAALIRDILLLLMSAVYFYFVFNLGGPAGTPAALQWVPELLAWHGEQLVHAHRVFSVLLLLFTFNTAVLSQR